MLLMGKYYRAKEKFGPINIGDCFRATLCTFCSMRKVENYHKCLFAGKGQIDVRNNTYNRAYLYTGCDWANIFEEITEDEYVLSKVNHMIKEDL